MSAVLPLARLMQGNEAIVEGALAAGVRFFAGYPITPSTEIAEILSDKLPTVGGKYIQMEDELGSMAAVIGASLAGLKSMTATSGPGFSLKQENLGFAIMAVIIVVGLNMYVGGLLNNALCKVIANADAAGFLAKLIVQMSGFFVIYPINKFVLMRRDKSQTQTTAKEAVSD